MPFDGEQLNKEPGKKTHSLALCQISRLELSIVTLLNFFPGSLALVMYSHFNDSDSLYLVYALRIACIAVMLIGAGKGGRSLSGQTPVGEIQCIR